MAPLLALLAFTAALCAGEEPEAREPGLRMDPEVIRAAAALLPDAPDDGRVVPGIMITEGAAGYMVTRYAVMHGKEEKSAFFRVRTLVGRPARDVAVRLGEDGTLLDLYDLRPPKPKKGAPARAEPAPAGNAEADAGGKASAGVTGGEDPAAADPKVRADASRVETDRIPSQDVLRPLLGRKPAEEAASLAALLRGIAKAATLIDRDARDQLPELPLDAFVFQKRVEPKKKLPPFALKTLKGEVLTPEAMGAGFKALFFTALQSDACKALNQNVAAALKRDVKVADIFAWVLSDARPTAAALANQQDLAGHIGCDDENAVSAAFGVPVKPMLLVYDKAGLLVAVVTPENSKNLDKLFAMLEKTVR